MNRRRDIPHPETPGERRPVFPKQAEDFISAHRIPWNTSVPL